MIRTPNLGILFAATPLLLVIFLIGGAGRYLPDGLEVPVIALILLCPIIACLLGHYAIGELKGASLQQAKSARIIAKAAATLGYLELLVLVLILLSFPHRGNHMATNESSAAVSLRSFNWAVAHYQKTHISKGFPRDLRTLSIESGNLDAQWAIDASLASGVKSGYRFTFVPEDGSENGQIQHYTIYADPVGPRSTGVRHFFTDETGVIRYGLESAANSSSSALE